MDEAHGLEIEQDLRWQEAQWAVQRIAWACFGAIVIAAMLGVFGHGWLSNASQESSDGVTVDYERFTRLQASTHIKITAQSESAELRLRLSAGYLDEVELEGISPEPESLESDEAGVVYVFSVSPSERVSISFLVRPSAPGRLTGEAGLDSGDLVAFRQLVYP